MTGPLAPTAHPYQQPQPSASSWAADAHASGSDSGSTPFSSVPASKAAAVTEAAPATEASPSGSDKSLPSTGRFAAVPASVSASIYGGHDKWLPSGRGWGPAPAALSAAAPDMGFVDGGLPGKGVSSFRVDHEGIADSPVRSALDGRHDNQEPPHTKPETIQVSQQTCDSRSFIMSVFG